MGYGEYADSSIIYYYIDIYLYVSCNKLIEIINRNG